jgi:Domain of unknown function (DUF4177)
MRRSPPKPGSSFNGTSREPAPPRSSTTGIPTFEHKIHTQRDKTFSGAFDPTEFEAALNAHAADGWRLAEGFMVSSLWKSIKSEIVLSLERPLHATGPAT